MGSLFISHASDDDGFVRELRLALSHHGQESWIDSRELRGGDPLWTDIRVAIEHASAFAVVVSPSAFQSEWVGKELRHAIATQRQRGKDRYPVIPLSLNGTKLGVLKDHFDEEPTYIATGTAAGSIEATIDAILAAPGQRLPTDVRPQRQPRAEPLEELVLELTDLKFHEQDGIRRASAHAQLIHQPATPGKPKVESNQSWRFVAPIGPIEAQELRWYLEKYAVWPGPYFRDRALTVEEDLVRWGRMLHDAAMPVAHTANVMQAWARIDSHAGPRADRRAKTSKPVSRRVSAPCLILQRLVSLDAAARCLHCSGCCRTHVTR